MNDIDLSGVEPRRWPEIRRRVAILCEYVAIDEPTGETTKRFAQRMGVGLSSFYALARIWRDTHDASKIHGARRGDRKRRAFNMHRNLPKEALAIVAATIDRVGVWSRDGAIYEEVGRSIAEAGLQPVSKETTRLFLLRARSKSSTPSDMKPAILIERCVLKLPLAHGGTAVLPQAILAIALPENIVIAWRLGTDDDPPSVSDLVNQVVALGSPGSPGRPLSGPSLASDELAQIDFPVERTSRRMRLRLALGANLGGVDFVTQISRAVSAASLVHGRLDLLMSRQEVESALEDAIARHNAGKGRMPPFSVATTVANAHR